MLGFAIWDVVVVVLYFAAMLYIGYLAMKKIKNQEDFFLGGRSFGRFLQTFSMFGQATSAETAVSSSTLVGQKGLAGVFFATFSGLLSLPIFWFVPMWMRRVRLMTLADFFLDRFKSRKLAALYAVAQTSMFILVGAIGLQAMSKTVTATTPKPVSAFTVEEQAEYDQAQRLKELEAKPATALTAGEADEMAQLRRVDPRSRFSYINRNWLIVCTAIFVLLYAAGGGLEAAVWTDAVQSVFILMLTVLLVPFAMVKLNAIHGLSGVTGAFEAVHKTLPASLLEFLGSPKLAGFTWYYMLLLSLIGLAGSFAYSNNLVVSAAARSEDAARQGAMNGIILKRVSTVLWAILALFILTLYGTGTKDPDLLWGMACKDLLPVGLLGLMLACLLAALMSSADTHMVVISGLITNNIYKPLVPGKGGKHYLTAGRLFSFVHITGGVIVALTCQGNLFDMLVYMLMINVTMGPAILMGMIWRRTNASGVWCSMGVSLLLTLVIPVIVSSIPAARTNSAFHLEVKPPPIERTYTARAWDVTARQKLIDEWDAATRERKTEGNRPPALTEGERFTQTYQPPAKAVFWAKGIKMDEGGTPYGNGLFRAELFLIHKLGLDLSTCSVATVESISLLFKLVFPFAAILLFGLLGKPTDKKTLDLFFGKMLTPVKPDPEEDEKEMAATRADPHRFDHIKLWPESDWNLRRWDKEDWKGILISGIAIVGITLLMLGLATIGSG